MTGRIGPSVAAATLLVVTVFTIFITRITLARRKALWKGVHAVDICLL